MSKCTLPACWDASRKTGGSWKTGKAESKKNNSYNHCRGYRPSFNFFAFVFVLSCFFLSFSFSIYFFVFVFYFVLFCLVTLLLHEFYIIYNYKIGRTSGTKNTCNWILWVFCKDTGKKLMSGGNHN
jgi:hypothetical protein